MPNVETDAPTVAAPLLLGLLELLAEVLDGLFEPEAELLAEVLAGLLDPEAELLVEVLEGLLEPEAEPVDGVLLPPVELAPAVAEPLSWTAVFTQLVSKPPMMVAWAEKA